MQKIFLIMMCSFILSSSTSVTAEEGRTALSISEAVKEAIDNNPNIGESIENINSAGSAVKSARADLFAKASTSYAYVGLSETPVLKNDLGEFQIAHENQYHWDITLVQPLFTGFALTTTLDMAKLTAVATKMEKAQIILDLARDVKISCYNLLLSQKLLMVAEDEVAALTSHKTDAALFYEQGLIPYNDLLRSEVALANAVQEREKAGAGVKKAGAYLNTLMASEINRAVSIEDISAVSDTPYDFEELSREAMNDRPVLKILRIGAEKLGLAEKLAKSTWYPDVALVGSYERDGDDWDTSHNDYSNRYNSSLMVQAKWTFFEWGKTRAEVNKARHSQKALLEKIRAIRNNIRLEVKNALLNLRVAGENIKTAEKSLGQAKENWRITNLQYQQQVATSTDVLDARAFLTQADTNYFQALYGYMAALSELERAVGRKP